mgnify:FL=1
MHDATTPITVKSAFESLKAAGYPRPYVERLLPDWWDHSLFKTSAGAFQFALLLKQRLGLVVNFAQDGSLAIDAATPNARFKRRRGTEEGALNIAASLGMALARLSIFSAGAPYSPLPPDPNYIGHLVRQISGTNSVGFEGLLALCWAQGIPVLFLKDLPKTSKRMTGMAVSVQGRPAIVLGFNSPQHARQLFVLAHELAHIVCGHVGENGVLIDEDIAEVTDALAGSDATRKDAEEKEADSFALALLRNGHTNVLKAIGRPDSAAVLASNAVIAGEQLGVDPGHLILSYARENDDWARANQALGYIADPRGAIEVLNQWFMQSTDLGALSDENREHVLAIQGCGSVTRVPT